MTKPKITPEIVKKIELSLEERKARQDRRKTPVPEEYSGAERRSGRDRRDKAD